VVLYYGNIADTRRPDAIAQGSALGRGGAYGTYNQCLVVYRGVKKMPFEWINEWRAHIDKHVCMATNITATRSLLPALQISNCHNHIDDPDYKPVLFVFLLKNYNGFSGWRLTNSNYTPYPQE